MARVARRTVDLSAYPDLIVIYLGLRVNALNGTKNARGLGPQIAMSVAANQRTAKRSGALVSLIAGCRESTMGRKPRPRPRESSSSKIIPAMFFFCAMRLRPSTKISN